MSLHVYKCILYYEDGCDIIYNGVRYLNFYDFIDNFMVFRRLL